LLRQNARTTVRKSASVHYDDRPVRMSTSAFPASAPIGTVPSPCISVCRIDPATAWCEGCLRTIDEIAHWGELDDDEKRAIWIELGRRRTQR
jgi:hypothetical protein